MTKIRRVVLIQNQLQNLGGVSRWCSGIATALAARGYDVEIGGITHPTEPAADYYPASIPTWVLSNTQLVRWADFGRLRRQARYERSRRKFEDRLTTVARQKFASYGPETVIIFTQVYARQRAARALEEVPLERRPRIIGQYHNDYRLARRDRDHERAFRAYRDDDLFTCLSPEDANLFRVYGLNNAISVDNPVVIPDGSGCSTLTNPCVVSLSRYDSTKQIDHMVKAWTLVNERAPEWELHLYGSGPEEENLRTLIRDSKLDAVVKLMGPTDDPIGALRDASISINSSQYEGFGLALGEAALLGVPSVVYASSPGIQEVVRDGETGLAVPPNDVSALAHGLLRLIEDAGLRARLGTAAQRYVASRFNLEVVTDTWELVFRNLAR